MKHVTWHRVARGNKKRNPWYVTLIQRLANSSAAKYPIMYVLYTAINLTELKILQAVFLERTTSTFSSESESYGLAGLVGH